MLCLLNRSDFSSGVLAEVWSEFSPSWTGRAPAQRLAFGLNRQFMQEMRTLHFITAVVGLVQRSLRLMEKLQLNSIALEQANVCNLYFSLFSLRILDIHSPVYSHTFPISYFLFAFDKYLRALHRLDKSETEGKWPVISQLGDILQVLGWKKKSNLYLLFHTSDLLSSSWNICPILLKKKIFRKLCKSMFVSDCFVNSQNMRNAILYLLVLKKQNFFFQKELYMLIKLIFLCFS